MGQGCGIEGSKNVELLEIADGARQPAFKNDLDGRAGGMIETDIEMDEFSLGVRGQRTSEAGELGERFSDQHAGDNRPAREMSSKKLFIAGERPDTARGLVFDHFGNFADEAKRGGRVGVGIDNPAWALPLLLHCSGCNEPMW